MKIDKDGNYRMSPNPYADLAIKVFMDEFFDTIFTILPEIKIANDSAPSTTGSRR